VCAAPRTACASAFRTRAASALTDLAGTMEVVQAGETNGNLTEAQRGWTTLLSSLRAVSDDLGLARTMSPDAADAELSARAQAMHERIVQANARLAGRPVVTVEDLSFVLAAQLARAVGERKPLVQVPACTVRGSRLSSPFGRFLAHSLTGQLTAAGWRINAPNAVGPTREAAKSARVDAVVLGATWDRPDGVHCVLTLHALADGRVLAAAEATLPIAGLTASGLAVVPQNAEQALADQQQFRQGEIIGAGMHVDVWTSQGDDAPVFVQGERVLIFTRVDRPCYLRIVYHLADGRRALLVDSLFIDQTKVNQIYQLPDEFEVAAPFGAETIQVNASTATFAPLPTRTEDGYAILTSDLAAANVATRGLKKIGSLTQQAERRIVVTTMDGK
ncbi:MAG: DUF4384 domain-containing protein, partial [Planctomycetota bacterium]